MFWTLLQKRVLGTFTKVQVWFVWMRDGNHKSKSPLPCAQWRFLHTPSIDLRVRWVCFGCVAHNSSIAWRPSSIDRYEPDRFLRQSPESCIGNGIRPVPDSYEERSHPGIGLDWGGFLCTTLGSCDDEPGRQTNKWAGPGLMCWTPLLPYAFVKACKTFTGCSCYKINRFSFLTIKHLKVLCTFTKVLYKSV